jgi:alcohol dehydrogenase (cytochrome c)
LREINRANVRNLVPAWGFQTGTPDGLEATPLFVNGVLYLSTSWDHIFAIDARTGAELWHYRRRLPEKLKYCCGPVNRGVAILGGTLYLGTLDAHLVALNARDGRVRWDVEVGKVDDNVSITSPPLVAGNKIITGMAGGDYPSRGFIDAYDADTGKRLWRFYTVPAEGEPGVETWSGDSWKTGGGATWMNGSYDAAFNLIYWGTGNPYPDYDGDVRQNRNLYCNSVVALNADTGKLVWTYQFTPHDVWDYDGVNEMVFATAFRTGPPHQRPAAPTATATCSPSRATGLFCTPSPSSAPPDHGLRCAGRPAINPVIPSYEGAEVCPAPLGKEWNAVAYSPPRAWCICR